MINTLCGSDAQRFAPPQAARTVWTVGCVQALATLLEANVVPVSCAVSGIAVLQVNISTDLSLAINHSFVLVLNLF